MQFESTLESIDMLLRSIAIIVQLELYVFYHEAHERVSSSCRSCSYVSS